MISESMDNTERRCEPNQHPPSTGEYRSFLVRLWQSHAEGVWHASVQSIQTGTTMHFVDLAALFHYLDTQASAPANTEIGQEGNVTSGLQRP